MSIITQNQKKTPTPAYTVELIIGPGKILNLLHASGGVRQGLRVFESTCGPSHLLSLTLCPSMLCGIHER